MEQNHSASDHSPADTSGLIGRRAYELWQQAGCPDGQDVQHWLQAESEICGKTPAKAEAAAASPKPRPAGKTAKPAAMANGAAAI